MIELLACNCSVADLGLELWVSLAPAVLFERLLYLRVHFGVVLSESTASASRVPLHVVNVVHLV